MLEVIRDVYDETGLAIGMKPAGGIRTAKQAIQYLVRPPRDARHRLADARPVPLRRLVAPQRRAAPAPEAAHRHLPVARRVHDRLMGAVEKSREGRSAAPARWEYASSLEGRDIVSFEERYGLFIGGEQVDAAVALVVHDRLARPPRSRSPRSRRRARRTSRSPSMPRARRSSRGAAGGRPSGRRCSSGSRGSSRSARASSRSRSRSTAASRSRSHATSTFRSRRRTSSTTQAGPTSSSTLSPDADRVRSASPRRSCRGTSRF